MPTKRPPSSAAEDLFAPADTKPQGTVREMSVEQQSPEAAPSMKPKSTVKESANYVRNSSLSGSPTQALYEDKPLRPRFTQADELQENNVFDALERSRRIIDAAQSDADHLLEDARELAIAERAEARRQGYEDGRVEAIRELLRNVNLKERLFEQSRQDILHLVTMIAREVIGSALCEQPESILERIDRALQQTINSSGVTLFVNSEDLELVRELLPELSQGAIISSVQQDQHLPQGNARLETELSVIESSIEAHIEAIKAHLEQSAALRQHLKRTAKNALEPLE